MKKKHIMLAVLVFGLIMLFGCAEKVEQTPFRVMTFNVRLNTPNDGDNAWPNRKDIATSMVRFYDADIFGVQEALKDQMDDLTERLPDYGWYGVGRDDGKDAGEFMSVFYKKDRFEALKDSTFWLSETPDSVSKGWDARCFRVVTVMEFKDKMTGKIFYLFNTHFDHMGQVARRESANLLLKSVKQIAGDLPVIITGDFNSSPESEPYKILTQGLPDDSASKVIDSKLVSKYPHHGPSGTITRFESANLPDNWAIDHIFIKNNVSVIRHGTLSDTFDGRFPSDHMLVLAEVLVF